MANQQYIKLKVRALASDYKKKKLELEAIEERVEGYVEQLDDDARAELEAELVELYGDGDAEPDAAAKKDAGKKS